MSRTLIVFGASDDLIEVSGVEGADEFNAYGKGNLVGSFTVTDDGVGLRVHCIYDGYWSFAVGGWCEGGEDVVPPPWPIRVLHGVVPSPVYSMVVEIDVPDSAVVAWDDEPMADVA